MSRAAKAAPLRRPRPVYVNAIEIALNGARRLSSSDALRSLAIAQHALDQLLLGAAGTDHWRSLADTANMAETLCAMGLCSGAKAEEVIADAQQALAYAQQERAERKTWALRGQDREELRERLGWLIALHREQLARCSYREFEQAFVRTQRRMAQALAGNAPRGAIVIHDGFA